MGECFVCGVSDNKAFLFDVVSDKGIVKICRNCFYNENLPMVKISHSTEKPEKRQTTYERLSILAGLDPAKMRERKPKSEELLKQESDLRIIVEEKFKKNLEKRNVSQLSGYSDLVRNFHWIIMRARRIKHLTQKQLAEAISVPEIAIKTIEQGILHDNSERLIKKIENYLGIKITKKQEPAFQPKEIKEEKSASDIPEPATLTSEKNLDESFNETGTKIDFDLLNSKNLTIADLREMKERKERSKNLNKNQ
jgi:ribosome-binding protein aMBF1 (putative translation factor)